MRKSITLFIFSCLLIGCASLEQRQNTFVATGLSFQLLGLQIPDDSYTLAEEKLPKNGAQIRGVYHVPSSWETFIGALFRIIGIGVTQISGTIEKPT